MVKSAQIQTGGFVPLTTIDYPGLLAAVVFLSGCPWSCRYCHNPALRGFGYAGGPSWEEILEVLQRRRGLLEGVVFSGGEPTAQDALGEAMQEVRCMGFAVGLHTGGACPEKLARILPFVDWVGLDVKAPPDERYDFITQRKGSAACFLRSLQMIRESGVAFTLRTTVDPRFTAEQDFLELQDWLAAENLPPTIRQEATFAGRAAQ